MSLTSRTNLLKRLLRGRKDRQKFVESHLSKGIAYQIRATREKQGLSQPEFAALMGKSQQAISRLENPDYGKQTITSLKEVAAALDVGLVVRLAPFSEMLDWVSGTPRVDKGLTPTALAVPSFEAQKRAGELANAEPAVRPLVTLDISGVEPLYSALPNPVVYDAQYPHSVGMPGLYRIYDDAWRGVSAMVITQPVAAMEATQVFASVSRINQLPERPQAANGNLTVFRNKKNVTGTSQEELSVSLG